MRKSKLPSKKQIRSSLLEALFDPRAANPMSLVMEIAEGNPRFLTNQALLLIRESQEAALAEMSEEKLVKAMSLLAMARTLMTKATCESIAREFHRT